MTKQKESSNDILQQLNAADRAKVDVHLEPVPMAFKETLFEFNKPIKYVYFPTSGVASLVTDMREGGDIVETGTIGREGMVGIPAFLGASRAPGRAFVQVPGAALRMETKELLATVARIDALRQLLLLYTNALMSMVAQSAACNRAHAIEARMARWLLTTHDRVDGDEFPLTQEFIGQMLGVRRPAVNIAGRSLQAAELITYSRGKIRILDRPGLEEVSCECYRVVAKQMQTVRLAR
ncbi:MAG: Crp/Fnr family transcriptional regulator [Myxococcota bacterium]